MTKLPKKVEGYFKKAKENKSQLKRMILAAAWGGVKYTKRWFVLDT